MKLKLKLAETQRLEKHLGSADEDRDVPSHASHAARTELHRRASQVDPMNTTATNGTTPTDLAWDERDRLEKRLRDKLTRKGYRLLPINRWKGIYAIIRIRPHRGLKPTPILCERTHADDERPCPHAYSFSGYKNLFEVRDWVEHNL
jgi:hypothetical protein